MPYMKAKTIRDWSFEIRDLVPGSPQVEIKDGTGVVIIVSLGEGYRYKYYGKRNAWTSAPQAIEQLKGVNVHFALNSALQCSFTEWAEINGLIEHARYMLEQEGA